MEKMEDIIREEILFFFKNNYGFELILDNDAIIFENKNIVARDVIWLFVWLAKKYNLNINHLPIFAGNVSLNGIVSYFCEVIQSGDSCSY